MKAVLLLLLPSYCFNLERVQSLKTRITDRPTEDNGRNRTNLFSSLNIVNNSIGRKNQTSEQDSPYALTFLKDPIPDPSVQSAKTPTSSVFRRRRYDFSYNLGAQDGYNYGIELRPLFYDEVPFQTSAFRNPRDSVGPHLDLAGVLGVDEYLKQSLRSSINFPARPIGPVEPF
ncbi:uncharacterized protein LOC136036191 [Artemia franciscana]|uniref:uncharacterized protein LOC136036191 n=1 Tax=Artemia franciscana TaxID=6661 RepID=UPI0032DAEAE6